MSLKPRLTWFGVWLFKFVLEGKFYLKLPNFDSINSNQSGCFKIYILINGLFINIIYKLIKS